MLPLFLPGAAMKVMLLFRMVKVGVLQLHMKVAELSVFWKS